MYKTILRICIVCLACSAVARAQSGVEMQFFLPGGAIPSREITFTISCDHANFPAPQFTDKTGKYLIKVADNQRHTCSINAYPKDYPGWQATTLQIILYPGLSQFPVFLKAAESAKPASVNKYADVKEYDERAPAEARAAFERGASAHRLSKIETAINEYTQAIKIYPQYLGAINQLGLIYFNNNRYGEAIGAFTQAVSIDSRADSSRFNLGVAFNRQGNSAQALRVLSDLVRERPAFSIARPTLAEALIRVQQWDEAEEQLKLAVADAALKEEARADAHYMLSRVMAHSERFKSAIAEVDKALALKPDWPNAPLAYLIKGGSLIELKRFEEGEESLIKAYQIGGKRAASANLLLGQLYYNQKKYEPSLKAFEQYLKDVPAATNNTQIAEMISLIKRAMKNP